MPCPFAASSVIEKPPGGMSPTVKVMVTAIGERSNNQAQKSFR
jgi:hypothetical protein